MEVKLQNRLKDLRVEKGYTQQFMADYLGYSGVSGYSELERNGNNIDLKKAIKLSKLFDVEINEIFLPQEYK